MERVTGLEPATVCLEGRHSSQLSYTRKLFTEGEYSDILFKCKSFFKFSDVSMRGRNKERLRGVYYMLLSENCKSF